MIDYLTKGTSRKNSCHYHKNGIW